MSDLDNVTISEDGRSSSYTYGGRIPFTLAQMLDRALALMGNDPQKAAGLFMGWCAQDTEIAKLVPDLITPYLEDRIRERSSAANAAAKE